MFARVARRCLPLACAFVLASCAQSTMPPLRNQTVAPAPNACYVIKQAPVMVKATITFYGWPDNSPPGNHIAHPVIHNVASGDGTYCNPTTFATERSNDKRIPYGIKIYVPFLRQYFIREDLCAASGPPTGSGSNGCYKLWFDLWIGGNARSKAGAVIRCEDKLTPNVAVPVILYPDAHLPVKLPGPIYRNAPPPNGTCYGKPEGRQRNYSIRRTILPN
jgi:hypothetical protein